MKEVQGVNLAVLYKYLTGKNGIYRLLRGEGHVRFSTSPAAISIYSGRAQGPAVHPATLERVHLT